MDISSNSLALFLLIIQMHRVKSQCLLGCSCMSDRHGRSIICMDSTFGAIPENLPEYITKIRIEKSHFTDIPRGAFLNTPALENLWLNFNEITVINSRSLEGLGNLTELHLQGNKLRSVSWTAFEDTPALVILDLKHNKIDVIPEHALKFLPELAYLDLSFNLLTVISKEVFLNWPLYQAMQSIGEGVGPNIVLALHDNAWLCDCRLKGFVEFIKSLRPPIILMNSYLKCSGPDFRAGTFFHEIELKECMKPVTTTSSSNISMSLGENITLHCLAKARPEPVVWWTYGVKVIRGFQGKSFSDVILLDTQTPYNFVQLVFYSESQERVDEDTISSHLQIPSIHLSDRGIYTCTANNFIGNFSISILLDVRSSDRSSMPHGLSMGLSMPVASAEENIYIEIHIAKQTVHGITIEWYAVMDRPDETWFTVHFGRTDTFKKELIHIGPRINSYSVSDLLPATKYDICVTLKNNAPRPEQCVIFVIGNDISELEQREKIIHIIVIVLAMVLAVPAGMYACTTDTKCNCCELISLSWKNCRRGEGAQVPNKHQERQGTFDSLQAASDEGLVNRNSSEEGKVRRRSEDRSLKLKGDPGRLTAELY